MLYKSMVRPHLEYTNLVWHPYRKEDTNKLEKMQRRATKLVSALKTLSYENRLKKLSIQTSSFRRLKGDMIESVLFSWKMEGLLVKLGLTKNV